MTHFEVHEKIQVTYTPPITKELKALPLKNTCVSLLVLSDLAGISMFLSLISFKMTVSLPLQSCICAKNSSIINMFLIFMFFQNQANELTNKRTPQKSQKITSEKTKKSKTHWFFSRNYPILRNKAIRKFTATLLLHGILGRIRLKHQKDNTVSKVEAKLPDGALYGLQNIISIWKSRRC